MEVRYLLLLSLSTASIISVIIGLIFTFVAFIIGVILSLSGLILLRHIAKEEYERGNK